MGSSEQRHTAARSLSVIVVGGGIAGLCTAIALRRGGHKVKILERSPLLDELGAAITFAPNAVKIFRSWDLDFARARLTPRLGQTFIDGTELAELYPTDRTDFEANYGAPYFYAHRVDFHRELRELATSTKGVGLPAELRTSSQVVEYDAGGGRVRCEDGTWSESVDLVVAADGVHSCAMGHVLEDQHCPPVHATSSTVIRFLIPTADILADPLTAPLLKYGDGHCSFYLHPSRQRWLVRYPCRDNTMQNFGMYIDSPLSEPEEHGWAKNCNAEDLNNAMQGFHPSLQKLVELTGASILPLWRCAEREPVTTSRKGRLVVVGDALHPMLPHRGFGAVSAIEDAAALGILFEHFRSDEVEGETAATQNMRVERLLRVFDAVRLPRTSVLQLYSQVEKGDKDPVEERREETLRLLAEGDLPAKASEVTDWVFGYDVAEAMRRAKATEKEGQGST